LRAAKLGAHGLAMFRVIALVASLSGLGSEAAAAQPLPATPADLFDRLDEAWKLKDLELYAGLWPASEASGETSFAASRFAADALELVLHLPAVFDAAQAAVSVRAELFVVEEPHGRLEEWSFLAEREPGGWRLRRRDAVGLVDGLLHLSLAPDGFRADGLTLRLEDFTLQMREGTLFTSPASVGMTALVFIGKGQVRFGPRPQSERQQLKIFCGREQLVEKVERAFIRINPVDFASLLGPLPLERDPDARRRFERAQGYFSAHAQRTFVLDEVGPRSPWWLVPTPGTATVTFGAGRRGTLIFSASSTEAEGISLFDRTRSRHINLYPRAGRDEPWSDASRQGDVVHHDLSVRFEPDEVSLAGRDTVTIDVAPGRNTLQVGLDEALRLDSVTSSVGSHRFFRMRGRNAVMVSLGELVGRERVRLTFRYSGRLAPGPIEDEVLQIFDPADRTIVIPIERVLVYTNRRAWYPRLGANDYARAKLRFDVPLGQTALSSGTLQRTAAKEGRRILEYVVSEPAKYLTVAVGQLQRRSEITSSGVVLEAHGVAKLAHVAEELLAEAADIVELYTQEFGPSPYDRIKLILLEGEIPGGHAPPGMVLLSRRPRLLPPLSTHDPAIFPRARHFFLAHELAHQWWGHGVSGLNYRERWISEGLAQYAAALWVRRAQGEEAFASILERMSQWVRRRNDRGPIHLGARLGHIKADPKTFRAIAYNKAAYVLHMLRGIIGSEPFAAALTTLQSERRFERIGTADLRAALERESGKDLGAYIEAWIYGTDLPSLFYSKRVSSGNRLSLRVRPTGLPGPVPLQVSLRYRGGTREELLELTPEGGSWEFELPGKPGKVELNSDQGLLLERIRK